MKITTTIASLGAAAALLASGASLAQEAAPDPARTPNTFRVGLEAVFWHTAATDLSGPFTPPGITADASNVQTAYLAYIRRLSENFDFEFAFGVPPKTDTIARGPATVGSVPLNGQTIGTVKWFAPSALLEYKFFDDSARLRPYVGAGVNFTHFYDRQINAAGDAVLGGPTYVTLKNSIGPVGTIGLWYRVMGHWSAVASFSASQVETKLETNTNGIVRRSTVNFNPQVIIAAICYSF